MRIKAKDPALIALTGEFLKVYLPSVRSRDGDTIDSYRHSINLYLRFLQYTYGTTIMTVRSCDFSQENIVAFMSWLRNSRGNVATTVNHRLSDIRGFCRYLMKRVRFPHPILKKSVRSQMSLMTGMRILHGFPQKM